MERVPAEVSSFLMERRISRAAVVGVAVSGGADSMALLYMLVALGQCVEAVHVHHGLRGAEADADVFFLRARAAALGIRFHALHVDATRADGRSPEARARELRYAALESWRESRQVPWLATAHTLDDQAETVLLRAIRGTGPLGLAGIRAQRGSLLRPLLGTRRDELRAYLRARAIDWREDTSNADLSVPRNRLRADALPLLEQIHGGATRKLAQLAQTAQDTESAIEQELSELVARASRIADGGRWLDASLLARAPGDLGRRAWLRILAQAGLRERITRQHLERIEAFVAAPRGLSLSLPQSCALVRDRELYWLGPASGPVFPESVEAALTPSAALEFPERELRLSWCRVAAAVAPKDRFEVPDELAASLFVRSPRPEDRIRLAGGKTRRVVEMFADANWPRRRRARALVVASRQAGGARGSQVLWVPGLASSDQTGQTGRRAWHLVAERLSRPLESC